ncbi:uncharacterized protein EURHEDRAFT_53139 [Aspergillus ruber CBS 135680]|uniref:Uncharacterized protein n=1 Tax=Aspergillus ruber (strain CBS 135680) TaxID=1388766 RepID=A0A017SGI1_ASPRC|nr:uncharacterized protein EURHEDRAFT_53139 [Aspergillus ruber CBS 135680]EYE95769.1 hypothetical protein EURHEDRAFT_53139 [Aspergillus ruber CBS 135680]
MSLNDSSQVCKSCREPIAEGSIGITSGMCLFCSANHGELQQQIPSSQCSSQETIELETYSPAQSGTEQAAGTGLDRSAEESKDYETKDADDSKGAINTGTTTPAEEESSPSNGYKVCPPALLMPSWNQLTNPASSPSLQKQRHPQTNPRLRQLQKSQNPLHASPRPW